MHSFMLAYEIGECREMYLNGKPSHTVVCSRW
jgi:hypothetical protein